jgi:hypothetical protein
MNKEGTDCNRMRVSIEGLRELAIYLEGIKQGRGGSLEPLGTIAIDNLWEAIRELQQSRVPQGATRSTDA